MFFCSLFIIFITDILKHWRLTTYPTYYFMYMTYFIKTVNINLYYCFLYFFCWPRLSILCPVVWDWSTKTWWWWWTIVLGSYFNNCYILSFIIINIFYHCVTENQLQSHSISVWLVQGVPTKRGSLWDTKEY